MEAAYEQNRSSLYPEQYFLLQIYTANCHFHRKQYRKARGMYDLALIARQKILRRETRTPFIQNLETVIETFPEHEIRYKKALCSEQLNEPNEALTALVDVPSRQRNLKINMMIGKLSMQTGKHKQADLAYRLVIRESPLNLEAIRALLTLNLTGQDISNLLVDCK